MGHLNEDYNDKKYIEKQDNKKPDNKIKPNSYEKIKDIVLGKDGDVIIEKNNIKNNKKPIIDIGL